MSQNNLLNYPVIKVVDEDFARNYTWRSEYHKSRDKNLINNNVKLVGLECLIDLKQTGDLILPENLDYEQVLIRDPYSRNSYLEFSNYEKITNKKRQEIFFEVLRLLGAKLIEVETEVKFNKSQCVKFSSDGSYKIVTAAVDYTEEQLQSKYSYLKNRKRFTGGWTHENYDEAVKIVKHYNLENDNDFASLLKSRNPKNNEDNWLLEDSIEVKMSEDLNKNKLITASLAIKALGGLKTEYKTSITESISVSMIASIEYADK